MHSSTHTPTFSGLSGWGTSANYFSMKETYYFKHDYHARHDPKMIKLLMKRKALGIGIYWMLIEMLYEQDGYLLLSECDSYAFEMRTQPDVLKDVILTSELFENDATRFWSNTVLKRLNERHDKSQKASNSAKIKWENANALRTQSDGNAIRGEERRKEKNINIPFAGFWDLYDHKVGSKPKSEKKWNNLKDEERQKIIDSLPAWKLKYAKDKKFQPHPLTYLNNERWNDEISDGKKDVKMYQGRWYPSDQMMNVGGIWFPKSGVQPL